MTSKVTTDNQ